MRVASSTASEGLPGMHSGHSTADPALGKQTARCVSCVCAYITFSSLICQWTHQALTMTHDGMMHDIVVMTSTQIYAM